MFKRDRSEGPLCAKATGPKGHYTQKELLDNKCRPEGPIRSNGTCLKGYVVTFRSDRSEGPLHSKRATGPKSQYLQKRPARRAITFKSDRPEGPLHSERAIRG
jgi:hypothetical protein